MIIGKKENKPYVIINVNTNNKHLLLPLTKEESIEIEESYKSIEENEKLNIKFNTHKINNVVFRNSQVIIGGDISDKYLLPINTINEKYWDGVWHTTSKGKIYQAWESQNTALKEFCNRIGTPTHFVIIKVANGKYCPIKNNRN